MAKLPNIHPGEVLEEEFLKPMGISRYRLAKEINVPMTRIADICRGRRAITADTALRLARYFGTSAELWMGLQEGYELEEEAKKKFKELDKIVPLKLTG